MMQKRSRRLMEVVASGILFSKAKAAHILHKFGKATPLLSVGASSLEAAPPGNGKFFFEPVQHAERFERREH